MKLTIKDTSHATVVPVWKNVAPKAPQNCKTGGRDE